MTSTRPIVFVSHASDDRDLVVALKGALEKGFGNALEFFVSSDGVSIPGGLDWMRVLETRLRVARVALLFVTRSFLEKRWCYFETGGAVFRDIAVLPAWYTDVTPADLPYVIQRIQGYQLEDRGQVKGLLNRIADECAVRLSTTDEDCAELQRQIGIGDPPSGDRGVEKGFEEYCLRLVRSQHITDRIAGARMLSGLRTPEALKVIIGQISDQNRHVRETAMRTLEYMTAAHGIDLVALLLEDLVYQPHEAIRESARLIRAVGKPRDLLRIEEYLATCTDACTKESLTAARTALLRRFV